MIHKMNLCDKPFEMIASGYKTIEMRLYDEKRSRIQCGDEIEFTNITTKEHLHCMVVQLYPYASFEELYANHTPSSIGYLENEVANPDDMFLYYSKEQIEKYGVLGIEIIKKDANKNYNG